VIAYNSATHGGDGFFLYAGHETVKQTGAGGCNRNLVYRNDFSHAAANGIECTFSEGNVFIDNVLDECTHGIWAGYSYRTIIARNRMAGCANGVSIEHGQDNLIAENQFQDVETGVHLWWDDDEELLASKFGTRRNRCPSTGNHVLANAFRRVGTAVRLHDDVQSLIQWNHLTDGGVGARLSGRADGTRVLDNHWAGGGVANDATGATIVDPESADGPIDEQRTAYVRLAMLADVLSKLPVQSPGSRITTLGPDRLRGRRFIFVDEWGPYDFARVRLFPERITGTSPATVHVLGSGEPFQVGRTDGPIRVSPTTGITPGTLTIEATDTGVIDFLVQVEVGPRRPRIGGSLFRADWTVRFYRWAAEADPREHPSAWNELIRSPPLAEAHVPAIDFVWGAGAPAAGVPADRFATVASASIDLPAGRWHVRTVSDDGIRVWIDRELVIDDWTWHPPKDNSTTVELNEGTHDIRVEHFEIDGHAQLQLVITRAP